MPIVFVVLIRSLISFFALLALVRLMGKQQMAEMTFFDYVVGITIGSIASTISVEVNQNLFSTTVGMAVWALLAILLALLSLHNVWIRKVVEGEAIIVIKNGKIQEDQLKKARISLDDLIAQLRMQGVFDLSDVEFALFEANGKLSIQKKSQKQPLTPADLNLPTQYKGLPTTLISDGKLLTDALKALSLSRSWLHFQLQKQNIQDFSQVSLAQLDTTGNLFVDLQGDNQYYIIPTGNGKEA
ncbi:MAG TPA: DUF421 domain-containing protein [Firmicutes bacterium]|nr:DUF421 domain-containing protein [Bacillota bacterium]HOQ23610.1 DUF421 domain-containing protein [Bacillota bacterium]HPT68054.1 DUF421 domain-containing protein [Bacillota bacterium]